MNKFAIVEFTETKTIGTIPWSWLSKNDLTKCHYPAEKQFKKSLKQFQPDPKWKIYDCRILAEAGKVQNIYIF